MRRRTPKHHIMKKYLLILFVLLYSGFVQAQIHGSNFSLNMFNNSKFAVRFDHVTYPSPGYDFLLENLNPGSHFVEVIKYRNNRWNNRVPVVISSRWINIPPNAHVSAMVDSRHIIRVVDIAKNCHVQINPVEPACDIMSPGEFQQLKQSIQDVSFDASKLTVAKQAASYNMLTAQQVAELMELMTFESTRLELAKFAFQHTYDKSNYYVVNSSFHFESSIDELNEFISHS